ncbi:MAG: hypothetical protein HGA83_04105 [Bacteroidales bacterium]|nr:hypothetical protein [Bacteroidales bacterium]
MFKLIHYRFKVYGLAFIVVGTILSAIYLVSDIRLKMPVIAIYSSFLNKGVFAVVETNIIDELILLFFLFGLLMVIFSEEKEELDCFNKIRHKSLVYALFINFFMNIAGVLFLYGDGFYFLLYLNLFSIPVIYLTTFTFLRKFS